MYIKDEELRKQLSIILLNKTRNQIVVEIKAQGLKFHQYQIDKFLDGAPTSLETLKKIDRYIAMSTK